jgi:hypothetical protein
MEDKDIPKKIRKQIVVTTDEDDNEDPGQRSRENTRKKAGSGLQSQKESSQGDNRALRQSQNSKIGMGSNQVKKQAKGRSTPKQQNHQQDDADEYDEDGFEDANNTG